MCPSLTKPASAEFSFGINISENPKLAAAFMIVMRHELFLPTHPTQVRPK